MQIESSPTWVKGIYDTMIDRLPIIRRRLGRPLSLSEKILLTHLDDPQGQQLDPGHSYLALRPDRVAMQDATAQMALLQFAHANRTEVAVPSTVHCDHLITARTGADADMKQAVTANQEVYQFLMSACQRYGIGFWQPGSGIIHQVVFEQYAFPGGLMIGTDSHTPNAGGLGMMAVGVGGADAVDVMAGFPWEVLYPQRVAVYLDGAMSGWTAAKDIILAVLGILSVKGGTNRIIEYIGPGARTISATGKGTVTNMGAELGATTSIFPWDHHGDLYLRATDRSALADLAAEAVGLLVPDPEVEADPERYYDQVVRIDLSTLEPHVTGPHSPDLARTVSELQAAVKAEHYPERLSAALIGSCTNSSYEDLTRAADIAKQAAAMGLKVAVPFMVTPGSEQIRLTAERDGLLEAFRQIGATVLANACGPCIGQWQRDEIVNVEGSQRTLQLTPKETPKNAIINSYNRNFPRRNDGNPNTLSFISSPEVTVAYGLFGRLDVNPLTDALTSKDGRSLVLQAPKPAPEIPTAGFARSQAGFTAPPEDRRQVSLEVRAGSDRLQLLDRFAPWDGQDFMDLPVLLKAQGKCTTDHISPAGPWLRFRGHLDHISDNVFIGAQNSFTGQPGIGIDPETGKSAPLAEIARRLKAQGLRWVAVADENYGEGSSREHAAMSPRFLGAAAVICRSFARIHESNLKKQGVLALTFADPSTYDRIRLGDRLDLIGLQHLQPGQPVQLVIHHQDGSSESAALRHTLSHEQIEWFRAGSALNVIADLPA
ncbi:MAG: aconitate hydratase [Sulfobacillus sp.]